MVSWKSQSLVEDVGAALLDVFVGDDVAGSGSRNFENFDALVAEEFAAVGAHLDGVFFFDFVILAVHRNRPGLERGELGVFIEFHADASEPVVAFGAKDLGDAAGKRVDLTGVVHRDDLFVEENDGDGILRHRGHGFARGNSHPIGHGIGAETRCGADEKDQNAERYGANCPWRPARAGERFVRHRQFSPY